MPIAKWRCPNCLLPQELDHFAATPCGNSVHPDYAAAVLADDRGKDRAGKIGVTDGLSCPRRKIISDTEQLTIDPLAANSPLTGTAWNEKLDAHSDSPEQCQVEVAGTILGLTIVGHIDRVRFVGGDTVIDDHKHQNDWSFKYTAKGEIKPEHDCQVSIYAELYRQTFGQEAAYAMIWTHATAGGFVARRVELWPLERCLSFKPHGGEFCVADLWLQVAGGLAGDWHNLPLAGEAMSFGSKSMCDYCSVRELCWTTARGASF